MALFAITGCEAPITEADIFVDRPKVPYGYSHVPSNPYGTYGYSAPAPKRNLPSYGYSAVNSERSNHVSQNNISTINSNVKQDFEFTGNGLAELVITCSDDVGTFGVESIGIAGAVASHFDAARQDYKNQGQIEIAIKNMRSVPVTVVGACSTRPIEVAQLPWGKSPTFMLNSIPAHGSAGVPIDGTLSLEIRESNTVPFSAKKIYVYIHDLKENSTE